MKKLKLNNGLRRLGGVLVVAVGISFLWGGRLLATSSTGIVPIDAKVLDSAAAAPIENTDYWTVVGRERPPAASVSTYVSADKALEVGVSRYDRVTLELRDWPVDEFMYILEGRVEITPTGSRPHVYGPGDAFVMPKGFSGTWKQLSNLRKLQVTYAKSG